MDRDSLETAELIDLGAASVETQGTVEGDYDGVGLIPKFGLSDD